MKSNWTLLRRFGRSMVYVPIVVLLSVNVAGQGDPALSQRISDWWSHKTKSYLIIAASDPHRDEFPPIPFADQDAIEMKSFFENTLHYRPLIDHALVGGEVNFANVKSVLESIHHGHNDKEVIVVYFSGHGNFGAGPEGQQDVVLILNDGSEQRLADWVRWARGKTDPNSSSYIPSYKGHLIFVLDACDSGDGVWRSALTPPELQLPTVVLASSTVGERSLQRLDSNVSAFSSVLRQALSTDWDNADADHDGFLEYRELKDYAKISLYKLKKDGKIAAEMHPEGNTDQHLFLDYNASKDNAASTYDHWQFITEIAEDTSANAATVLSTRADNFVRPTIPTSLTALASQIPENAKLPDVALGYRALALGKFSEALTHFRNAKLQHADSPYDVARANVGLARTKLFAGDHKNAAVYYEAARGYYGDDNANLLAEVGVNSALSGDLDKGNTYLAYAYWLTTKTPGQVANPGSPILSAVSYPFKWITRSGSKPTVNAEELSSLRILQSWAVLSAKFGHNNPDDLLRQSVALSSSVAKSRSPEDERTAAVALANVADVRNEGGDSKTALSLYKRADVLFDKVGDTSTEYATMLDNYSKTLKESQQPEAASVKSHRADQIKSAIK